MLLENRYNTKLKTIVLAKEVTSGIILHVIRQPIETTK